MESCMRKNAQYSPEFKEKLLAINRWYFWGHTKYLLI
jgi:hypothetical protein